ncbi:hypothetical protein PSHT_01764 [Puccinia striiformis]|uniref:Uncharacterized protein n=1 Tax=Puccinia striiformis TaxID=27350 RepID=A0A2S4WJR1_9BASI|nr:hypothetical protein PSHT_01764 [Puccinia striiformis]
MTKLQWPKIVILLQGLILCSCLCQSAHGDTNGKTISDVISLADMTKPEVPHVDSDGCVIATASMDSPSKTHSGMEKLSAIRADEEIWPSTVIETPTRSTRDIRPQLDYDYPNISSRFYYVIPNIRPTVEFVFLIWDYLRRIGFTQYFTKSAQENKTRELATQGIDISEYADASASADQFMKKKKKYTVQEIPSFAGRMSAEREKISLSRSTSMIEDLNGPGRKERLEDLVSKEKAETTKGSQDPSIEKSSITFQESSLGEASISSHTMLSYLTLCLAPRKQIFLEKTRDEIPDRSHIQTEGHKGRMKKLRKKFQSLRYAIRGFNVWRSKELSPERSAILDIPNNSADQFIEYKERYTVQEIPPFAGRTLGTERQKIKLSKSTSVKGDFNGTGRKHRLDDLLYVGTAKSSQGSQDRSIEIDSNTIQENSLATGTKRPNNTQKETEDYLRRKKILDKIVRTERTIYEKAHGNDPQDLVLFEKKYDDLLKVGFENQGVREFWESKAKEAKVSPGTSAKFDSIRKTTVEPIFMELLFESFRHGMSINKVVADAMQEALGLGRALKKAMELAIWVLHRKLANLLPLKLPEIQRKIILHDYKSWPQVMNPDQETHDQDLEDFFTYMLSSCDEIAAYVINRNYKDQDKVKIHMALKKYTQEHRNKAAPVI